MKQPTNNRKKEKRKENQNPNRINRKKNRLDSNNSNRNQRKRMGTKNQEKINENLIRKKRLRSFFLFLLLSN